MRSCNETFLNLSLHHKHLHVLLIFLEDLWGIAQFFIFFGGVCETLTKVGEGHAIRGAGCYQGWSLQRDRLTGCGERGVLHEPSRFDRYE